jgi:hypothetical protein
MDITVRSLSAPSSSTSSGQDGLGSSYIQQRKKITCNQAGKQGTLDLRDSKLDARYTRIRSMDSACSQDQILHTRAARPDLGRRSSLFPPREKTCRGASRLGPAAVLHRLTLSCRTLQGGGRFFPYRRCARYQTTQACPPSPISRIGCARRSMGARVAICRQKSRRVVRARASDSDGAWAVLIQTVKDAISHKRSGRTIGPVRAVTCLTPSETAQD